jgi:hypothetical protein
MSLQEMDEKSLLIGDEVHFPPILHFRDVWASVLFFLHVVCLVVLAIYCSFLPPVNYRAAPNEFWLVAWLASLHGRHLYFLLMLLGICGLIGVVWGLFLVVLLRSSAVAMIWLSCILTIVFSLATSIYLFVLGAYLPAAVGLVWTVLIVVFLALCHRVIPFTAVFLSTVAHVAKLFPGLLLQSLVSMAVWLVYLVLFFSASTLSTRIEALQGWHLIPMLLFFFWTQQVTQNFSHTVASGICASWYFGTSDSPSKQIFCCFCCS